MVGSVIPAADKNIPAKSSPPPADTLCHPLLSRLPFKIFSLLLLMTDTKDLPFNSRFLRLCLMLAIIYNIELECYVYLLQTVLL